jgi:hypothetical protein
MTKPTEEQETQPWGIQCHYDLPTAHNFPVESDCYGRVVSVRVGAVTRTITYSPEGHVNTVNDAPEDIRDQYPNGFETIKHVGLVDGQRTWKLTEHFNGDSYSYHSVSIDDYGIVHYQFEECDGIYAELVDGTLLCSPFARATWRKRLKHARVETSADGKLLIVREQSGKHIRAIFLDAHKQVQEVHNSDGTCWSIRPVGEHKRLISITNGAECDSYDTDKIEVDDQGNISYFLESGYITIETIAGDRLKRPERARGLVALSEMCLTCYPERYSPAKP